VQKVGCLPHEKPIFISLKIEYAGKVKVQLPLCLTKHLAFKTSLAPHHEDVVGSGGIAPHILILGTKWR